MRNSATKIFPDEKVHRMMARIILRKNISRVKVRQKFKKSNFAVRSKWDELYQVFKLCKLCYVLKWQK